MLWRALVVALLAAVFVADDLVPANVILSFLYSLALLAAVSLRSRRWLWGVAAASLILTLATPFFGAPATPGSPGWVMWSNRGLTVAALLAICAAFDRELVSRARIQRAEAALRKSERRFRTIFESAAIGIARVAFEGQRWIEVNDTFCHMLGRTQEEMLATPWTAMTHPDDIDLDLVSFRRMAKGELDRYAVEKRFIHKDGHLVWARLTLSLVRDREGRPDYEIAIMEDISQRKAQEEMLGVSEARQRELLATLDLGASMARDPVDDTIRFWSAGCEHLYGWTAADALGRPAHDLLGTVFPIPREEIAAALERDGEWAGDLRQWRRDGGEIVVSAHKALRRDQSGRPLEVLETLADVTAHRRAEAALAETEGRQGELLATLDLGAFMARDPFDDTIRFWSAGCERLYGWTAADAIGRMAHDLLHTVFPIPRQEIGATLERDGEWSGDLRQTRRDGVEIVVLAHKALRRDEDGRPVAVLESLADVTMEREAERVLARDKVELERLVEERTGALMRASEEQRRASEALQQGEKLQALGQLAGGVAHDFNNLLQIVAAGAEVLKKPTLSEARRAIVLDGIIQAARNARELTARLLAFARKQPLRPETIDLNARLSGMAELLRRTLGSRIEVVTDFADGLWPVRLDPSQLEIAVLNLAVNARDAMPEGGKLSLTTRNLMLPPTLERRAEDEFVRLVIRDTGVGMPPSVLSHVFEPFFTTKGPERGTGLGLAQVHGFAKQSGGDISVESAPGEGTAITLRLPRARATEAAELTVEPAPAERTRELGQLMEHAAGKRVLIVEDTPDVAAFAKSLLDGLGYQTRIARGAAEALSVLESGQPIDVVFSDVVMPGEMNGVDLARAVRQRWPDVAIVLVSGYSEALSGVEPELRAEVLAKPYVLDELGQALERALNRVGPRDAGPVASP